MGAEALRGARRTPRRFPGAEGWERSAGSCCRVRGGCRVRPARKSGTPLSGNLAAPPANGPAGLGNCYKHFMLKGNRFNSAGKRAFGSIPPGSCSHC